MSDNETPKRTAEQHSFDPPPSPSSLGGGKSDAESDAEQGSHGNPLTPSGIEGVPKEELVAMFKKQERVLARYKTRFSEVSVTIQNKIEYGLLLKLMLFINVCVFSVHMFI